MSHRLIALAVFLAVPPLQAAEPPKPNTLTPKEIADGWLLLFDGETTFGWQADSGLAVKDGMLRLGDATQKIEVGVGGIPCNYQLEFECRIEKGDGFFGDDRFGGAGLSGGGKPEQWNKVTSVVSVQSKLVGAWECRYSDPSGKIVYGRQSSKFEHGLRAFPPRLYFSVRAGLVWLRNVKLRPTGLESLFNGKDLTGWKEHPGKKSKFTVENGSIRIQNGPGDLQSEGQYDDFVLQIECKTNGNRLNSGVFFRCRPGEYQQGYEAQIHNGFGEPKEYTIEEYDPKTGRMLDKKKVKYAAMDYGTGAIYRRIPARKQLAKDNEWFTMTVIAAGRHIATWVNGVQVVDWTDNRPLKDNARNGCRLEKGPISFQGHDPTTDLNFRNIRIGELKK